MASGNGNGNGADVDVDAELLLAQRLSLESFEAEKHQRKCHHQQQRHGHQGDGATAASSMNAIERTLSHGKKGQQQFLESS